jgi:hypothetical protein
MGVVGDVEGEAVAWCSVGDQQGKVKKSEESEWKEPTQDLASRQRLYRD